MPEENEIPTAENEDVTETETSEEVDLDRMNKKELIALCVEQAAEIESLHHNLREAEAAFEKTAYDAQAGTPADVIPEDAVVIPEDSPYIDGVLRDYLKAEGKAPAARRARGLVLVPDDPAAIPALESFILRCTNPDEKAGIQAALDHFRNVKTHNEAM